MAQNKEQLEKLLKFIDEISNQKGNEWFKDRLIENIISSDEDIKSPIIDEIYEYCIQSILKSQADDFYSGFKLIDIKSQLEADFIRMEQFRRTDDFEGFCLALFQQLEAIVNRLCDFDLESFIKKNKSIKGYESSRATNRLWQIVFYFNLSEIELNKKLSLPILQWSFIEKYKAILYCYYFNKRVFSNFEFDGIASLGNELYQIRNLNHRGGEIKENQRLTAERVKAKSNRYYLKFLGFLEDFTSKINDNINV